MLRISLVTFCSYGYADFSSEDDAKAAVELTGNELDGRGLRIDFSNPREGGTPRGRGGRGNLCCLSLFSLLLPIVLICVEGKKT